MDQNSPNSTSVDFPRTFAKARVDDKGRIKLSAEYLHYFNALGERKVFVTSLDRRLAEVYPISSWKATEDFLLARDFDLDAAADALDNAALLGAEAEVDAQGRVLIHAELRRVLGLDGQELHLQPYRRNRIRILSEQAYKDMMDRLEKADPKANEAALRAAGRP